MTADLHTLLDTNPAAGLRGVAALMRESTTGARFILAVADWLDETADHIETAEHVDESVGEYCPAVFAGDECSNNTSAIATARAYLGQP